MITIHEEIKDEVKEHYCNWTGSRNFDVLEYDNHWKQFYESIEDIDEKIYQTLCEEITLQDIEIVLRDVKNDKAAGVSGIPYDFWKKSGENARKLLLDIINESLKKGEWPADWKNGLVYPIKKTMEWNRDLKLTRPITLIETACKITIKILTNRLSEILVQNNVLKGKNYAVLKYESTFEPIKVVQSVIEDANINKKKRG